MPTEDGKAPDSKLHCVEFGTRKGHQNRHEYLQSWLTLEAHRVIDRSHWAAWHRDQKLLVTANDGKYRVTVLIEPGDTPMAGITDRLAQPPTPVPGLSPVEQDALAAADHKPRSPRQLARRAERKFDSYFRAALTSLCRSEKLVRTPDGYKLP